MTEPITVADTIEITVNGSPYAMPFETTAARFLELRGLKDRLVVIELNGSILPKSRFGSTVFAAGDSVEIVHFVGGG
jgi:sulfur carrier protein